MKASWKWFAGLGGATLALDLATKVLVENTVSPYSPIQVVDGLFAIVNVRNTGAAFSLFSGGGGWVKIAFFAVAAAIAMGVILHMVRNANPSARLEPGALGLIFGGAAGNLFDRLRYGEVVDFLDVYWSTHHWPAFNVADIGIVVGIGLILAHEFTNRKKT